jgi:hypothetical protein
MAFRTQSREVFGHQRPYAHNARFGNIAAVIRSCWHGGVEALGACTQIGAKWVHAHCSEILEARGRKPMMRQ